MRQKVFVGLSGGVDSAVSAALLQKQGYDVVGVFIRITIEGYPCPAAVDRQEAMRVAAHLRIPFQEIDLSREYQQRVFTHTLDEYAVGRTPNPDTLCNREIKFGLFFDWAMKQGAEYIATGHYARVKQKGMRGSRDFVSAELYVGIDKEKDQSYFLWMVPQEHLKKVFFPIGDKKKSQVRSLAKKFGLPNAARKDSQGLCFLGDISITTMLERELAPVHGDVLSEDGAIIGKHHGATLYTLGQRHGFTLFTHTPDAPPQYIVGKDIKRNTITVSAKQFPAGAQRTEIRLSETNWIGEVQNGACTARFRYRQQLIPAELNVEKNMVVLQEPHYVPLGQSLVLYSGERCLGGGVIETAQLC